MLRSSTSSFVEAFPRGGITIVDFIKNQKRLPSSSPLKRGDDPLTSLFRWRRPQIGLTIFILTWVQLLVALFRPGPGTRIRRLWFLWHWFLGTGIIIMGGVNVFLGMALYHKYTDYGVQVRRKRETALVSKSKRSCFECFYYEQTVQML